MSKSIPSMNENTNNKQEATGSITPAASPSPVDFLHMRGIYATGSRNVCGAYPGENTGDYSYNIGRDC